MKRGGRNPKPQDVNYTLVTVKMSSSFSILRWLDVFSLIKVHSQILYVKLKYLAWNIQFPVDKLVKVLYYICLKRQEKIKLRFSNHICALCTNLHCDASNLFFQSFIVVNDGLCISYQI